MGTYPGLGIVSIDASQEASRDEEVSEGEDNGRSVSWFVTRPRGWRSAIVGSLKSAVGDG